jgi:hypothetical protein
MTVHDDGVVAIDDDGITISSYHLPGRSRRIPFDDVVHVELIPIGFFTGRHQLVGIGPFRPRLFFPWDRRRSTRSQAVVIDRGTPLRVAVTPPDPDRVFDLIRRRIQLPHR